MLYIDDGLVLRTQLETEKPIVTFVLCVPLGPFAVKGLGFPITAIHFSSVFLCDLCGKSVLLLICVHLRNPRRKGVCLPLARGNLNNQPTCSTITARHGHLHPQHDR